MTKYAGLIKNDFSAGKKTCVTFFTQGCPHRCEGCHNPDTWDFNGGKEYTEEVLQEIEQAIAANGILRNFCVMGGEPLCKENLELTYSVIKEVKTKFPKIEIYIWTGYNLEEIIDNELVYLILQMTDCVIDGKFILSERDTTLPMRGSRNQRILYKGKDFLIGNN